ncbi:tryptophan synthase subunit beta [Leucobacter sp. OLIS6]|uniref:tryptophan synthase subunit beta n=2 Tax=Leucobacter TaxID=55968 RepID=UPI000C19BD89|nr:MULTISPECIES: tryptophan synthase subunit beta [unclassified Leucobacter]PII81321.1 tryptophan synthase subunit beta [Leucobacter sp. OLCALW19]PII85988.1 tryptophan synthase subunit beta [Leucobacter sp. OLTLW20]PII89884.1 tryptophan synthase subunit beta [Leucobacter sp. OLAS13]PII96915.1 tryptophan synthase subunit beta [Leucobacter sp. OLDS2]PII99284.1 tryptophan synthase subunit beta [Leucobacter sp. OLCS4]
MTHPTTTSPDAAPSPYRADGAGYFGEFGGAILPPFLAGPMAEVAEAYEAARQDPEFQRQYQDLLSKYVGRPSLLYFAENLTQRLGGAKVYLKREDLNHTGAHKINHTLGEALLAKRMGKTKVIAETGAGQHGVALATAAALVGLECEIHMGAIDVAKQHPNVVRMELLGAKVVPVERGGRSLKEAVDSAFEVYAASPDEYLFAIGSVVGPHPFPSMVRDFQSVVGREARAQILEAEGRLPDALVACVGGGSNAMGLFDAFLTDESVRVIGVEPAGEGLDTDRHAATMTKGVVGDLHGMHTKVLLDENGEPAPVHSIGSGIDYPGVGPQHAHLEQTGRGEYVSVTDAEALDAFQLLTRAEGIIPALESSHALAHVVKLAPELGPDAIIIANLSGRGDKDVDFVAERLAQA